MTTTDPDPAMSAVPARGPTALLLGATLLLTALNLRAAVTSVGAVLPDIQVGVGMSDSVAGVLTTLPVLAFGVVGLLAARLGRRIGTDRALVAALLLITVGLVVRALAPTTGWVLVTSLVALCGIAIGNVLVPVTVKAWFPDAVGRYTGLYSLGIIVGTAVPLAVTVPLADLGGSWRFGLGIWAVPAALALVPWLVLSRRSQGLARPTPTVVPVAGSSGVRRSLKAWALMVFFGVQTMEASVAMGWLPSIFQDAGISAARAGLLTALTMVLAVPVALLVPTLAARRADQRGWVVLLTAASLLGYLGLWLAPGREPVLWAIFLGIGLGAFPLALLLIGLRARSPETISELSSLVQGWGYLLAAMGPLGVGVLHEVTGGWDAPLLALLVMLLPKLIAGWMAGAPGVVDGDPSDVP